MCNNIIEFNRLFYYKDIMSNIRKKFSVVEFSDGMQIVPSCWINELRNDCIWPSHIKSQYALDKVIAKTAVPQESTTWDTCQIKRLFGSAGKF